jgi:rod shape determining protein RodA
MKGQTNIIRDLDWLTIGLYTALVLFGWVNIYAAVYDEQHASIFSFSQRYGKQMIWIIAAVVLAGMICLIDVRFYTTFAYPIFIVGLLFLAAVLVVGREVNGARSWFAIGTVQLQPSEFAKITVSLALAKFLSNYNGRLLEFRNLLIAFTLIFLPPALIMLQPDVGSCLVYLAFFLVLYREGLPPSVLLFGILVVALFVLSLLMQESQIYLVAGLIIIGFLAFLIITRRRRDFLKGLGLLTGLFGLLWLINFLIKKRFELHELLLGAALLTFPVFFVMSYIRRVPLVRTISLFIVGALLFTFSVDFVFDEVLSAHQKQRVMVMLGLESDPLGVEYNVNQSKIAIGSGGVTGKGFLQGTQTKYNFVPEQSTDFIFCTVGEEWGFAGSAAVVLLFVALLLRLLYLAERQRSVFSRVYCYCVLSVFFLHLTINIGMTIGLMPVIGIPLPFFSYGGSALWAFTVLLFIMLRLDASRREYIR